MSEETSPRSVAGVKVCNVCQKDAHNRCSKCHTRVYCSRECQVSDFKQHKKYCRPPQTQEERMDKAKDKASAMNLPWNIVLANASDPNDIDSIEAFVDSTFEGALGFAPDNGGKMKWPPITDANWKLDDDAVWKELKDLPTSGYIYGREEWVISYNTLGDMDAETGFLKYQLLMCSNSSGAAKLYVETIGKPTQRDLEMAVYWSCMHPIKGTPSKPGAIMFANRWGEDKTKDISSQLSKHLGIFCHLETRFAALMSARENNTDPDGFNF